MEGRQVFVPRVSRACVPCDVETALAGPLKAMLRSERGTAVDARDGRHSANVLVLASHGLAAKSRHDLKAVLAFLHMDVPEEAWTLPDVTPLLASLIAHGCTPALETCARLLARELPEAGSADILHLLVAAFPLRDSESHVCAELWRALLRLARTFPDKLLMENPDAFLSRAPFALLAAFLAPRRGRMRSAADLALLQAWRSRHEEEADLAPFVDVRGLTSDVFDALRALLGAEQYATVLTHALKSREGKVAHPTIPAFVLEHKEERRRNSIA